MKSRAPASLVIVGAGLTGLALAYRLLDYPVGVTVLEARNRIGGRIRTVHREGQAPVEMGATWLGRKHRDLTALLAELGLPTFAQRLDDRAIYHPTSASPARLVILPPGGDPSFRIAGGSDRLISALADRLPAGTVRTGEPVTALRRHPDGVVVITSRSEYRADAVVSTLPPHLLAATVALTPALPDDLLNLCTRTHTWMGESIKVALTYAEPFWRAPGSSGTVFSSPGPATELYDHSNAADDRFALMGFFSGAYAAADRARRRDLLLHQLAGYYGPVVRDLLSYEETVWRQEPYTYRAQSGNVAPHQHNGDARFRSPLWEGKLWLAGTETASAHPGYLDGAVRSAGEVAGGMGFSR